MCGNWILMINYVQHAVGNLFSHDNQIAQAKKQERDYTTSFAFPASLFSWKRFDQKYFPRPNYSRGGRLTLIYSQPYPLIATTPN